MHATIRAIKWRLAILLDNRDMKMDDKAPTSHLFSNLIEINGKRCSKQ